MSFQTGGEQPPIPAKTLGNSGFYLDRRLRGGMITDLCAELVRVTFHYPEIEINVPHGFKEPAIDLIRSNEIKVNRGLIGETPKTDVFRNLAVDVPSLTRPLRGVRFGYPQADTSEFTGETYIGILPAQIEAQKVLEAERARSQVSIANTAGVNPGILDFDPKPLDARLGYAPAGTPNNILRKIVDVLSSYEDGIEADLLPAFDKKRVLPDEK